MSPESPIQTPHQEFNFDFMQDTCRVSVAPEQGTMHAYRLSFIFPEDVRVTVRVLLHDETGSDVVITNMTTLPVAGKEDMTHKGYGSKTIYSIIEWAKSQNLHEIRATQVGDHVKDFWIKNDFTLVPEPNPTKDYVKSLA